MFAIFNARRETELLLQGCLLTQLTDGYTESLFANASKVGLEKGVINSVQLPL